MFVNLKLSKIDRYVYRIIKLDRLKELFSASQNTLVKPKCWDDPFENFILSSRIRHGSGEIHEYDLHDRIYGQCWTFHKASDAIWRIYAPDKDGVRIRSRISDLALGLKHAHPDHTDAVCRIGRVRYLKSKEMRGVANNTFDDGGIDVDRLFESLLIKRTAFEHEREVRLLYFELDDSRVGQDKYAYEVNPHKMINQIMLDPRLSSVDAAAMKEDIRAVTGFEGPIKRSLLYAPPPSKILGVSDWEP